jgi:hypothetical protein
MDICDKTHFGPRSSMDLQGEIIQTHLPRDLPIDRQDSIPILRPARFAGDGFQTAISVK